MIYLEFARFTHWLKGIVIILPIIFSGKFNDYSLFLPLLKTFILFGLISSLTYCINDINDYKKDILHKIKKNKPIPSGNLQLKQAYYFTFFLLILNLVFLYFTEIDIKIKIIILIYFCISNLYTFLIKKIKYLEIIILSLLYQIRLISGCIVIGVFPSILMATEVYFITSLIFLCKRYSDMFLSEEKISIYHNGDRYLISLIYILLSLSLINYIVYLFSVTNINPIELIKIAILFILVSIGLIEFVYQSTIKKKGSDPVHLILKNFKIILSFLVWLLIELYTKIDFDKW